MSQNPNSYKTLPIMPVKTFKLSDGTEIPWIAFGTGTALVRQDCTDACTLALSTGFTHIDTAQVYQNEEGVGSAISASGIPRSGLYVTTKIVSVAPGKSVEDSLRGSLKKLQINYVDLFLVHAPDRFDDREGGLKQVWREMVDVKKKGLARSIGVSNFGLKALKEVIELGLDKPTVNQMEYHPLVSVKLEHLLSYSAEHAIVTASWGCLSPLFRGQHNDGEIASTCAKIVAALDEISKERNISATQNQLLFKWLEAKKIVAVTTSNKDWRIKEYLNTENIKDLTQDEIRKIEEAVGGVHYRFYKQFSFIDE